MCGSRWKNLQKIIFYTLFHFSNVSAHIPHIVTSKTKSRMYSSKKAYHFFFRKKLVILLFSEKIHLLILNCENRLVTFCVIIEVFYYYGKLSYVTLWRKITSSDVKYDNLSPWVVKLQSQQDSYKGYHMWNGEDRTTENFKNAHFWHTLSMFHNTSIIHQ